MPLLTSRSLAAAVEFAVSSRSSLLGRAAHGQVVKKLGRAPDPFLSAHLVNMYSKLDRPRTAEVLLFLTPSDSRSVVIWTALIAGNIQNGHSASAISNLADMRRDGIQPNDFTLPCLFKAAAALRSPLLGQQLHDLSIKLLLIHDAFVACSAFDMYSKTGLLQDAGKMFDEMPRRNIATWNAAISNAADPPESISRYIALLRTGDASPNSISLCASLTACSAAGFLQEGQQLHGHLVKQGHDADTSVLNTLVDFYGKCRHVDHSERVFHSIRDRTTVSWSTMLAIYEQNHMGEKACELFLEATRAGFEPTEFMLSAAISACAGLAALESGKAAHALAVKARVEGSVYVGSALVDMYGKCGSVDDCERAFQQMRSRNSVCWNAMIGAYAHQGRAESALRLFRRMGGEGARPNYVTFVSVLAGCSRSGMVDEGMAIFSEMTPVYGIRPGAEHYACIVDMLGRAGQVERAHRIIEEMMPDIPPTISIWGALLGACKMHGKPELGKVAAENLFRLDPMDSGNHVLLSNMLAAEGRWDEASLVREEMKDVGIKKGTGCSWISVRDAIHVFQAKDTSHPRNSEIQTMLTKLRRDMKAAGYVPDTKVALYDLEDEEKESEVWSHSEKIALAFGLVALPTGIPIRITKNLRVCNDCHSAIKFVSGIVEREIVVRDNNRYHHFRDNRCSCGDYW
ncbi:hypothetical protein M569_01710 [Genlisea aurea]|uniref:DYW domain-containing protein n=1 Tax=Genlisea aurea TaxID=192259 RepID=S8CZW2_9LAMI|nr:hypothetical protein M569_01710 [Genlisea aurea]